MYADDLAIVGGFARLDGRPIMLIGHQKGRDTKERVRRNYGMPKPEGYRKALRLMKLAERFRIPVITLIDTPGAYPGVGSEERNQSEAIARNLFEMARLRVPVITAVIGEGGSGGALAIGVCDRLIMLQYSVYSVISPEGCASILWKSADKKELAADAMGITAERLSKLGLVDEVLKEPLGGAHRDPQVMADALKEGAGPPPRRGGGLAGGRTRSPAATSGCARKACSTRPESRGIHARAAGVGSRRLPRDPRRARVRSLRRAERRPRLDRAARGTGARRARTAAGRRCARSTSITACTPTPSRWAEHCAALQAAGTRRAVRRR